VDVAAGGDGLEAGAEEGKQVLGVAPRDGQPGAAVGTVGGERAMTTAPPGASARSRAA
jgi:hypothetical protein